MMKKNLGCLTIVTLLDVAVANILVIFSKTRLSSLAASSCFKVVKFRPPF